MDDPARPLLQAIRTSARTRLIRRAGLLGGATALVAATAAAIAQALAVPEPPRLQHGAALVALLATGIAVHALCEPHVGRSVEVAGAAILGWVAAAATLPDWLLPASLRMAWLDHPWPIAAAAGVLSLAAAGRSA